ncbi:MAG TPA: class I SAM-dependent methyltransferase [Xanthobacteraceae bacterium]|jgi:SAM-dependent methyltransferase
MSGQRELFTAIHDKYYEATTDRFATEYKVDHILEPIDRLLDPNAKSVIELACGDGSTGRWLKRRRPGLQVVGTDISEKAAQDYERATGSRCYVADFTKPFDIGERFDAAIACGGIHHFVADLEAAFENIRRLLRPGGALIMSEPNADYFLQPLRALWYRLDRKNFEACTERALSHDEMLKQFSQHFRCESVVYKGGPGALLLLHNWALRIPQSWKPWYARPLMAAERAWERLPTKLPFNFFVAKWVAY